MEKVRQRVLGPDEEAPADDFYLNVPDPKAIRNNTALRQAERKFKNKNFSQYLHEAIDFDKPSEYPRSRQVGCISDPANKWLRDGAGVWEVDGIPGFRVIPSALGEEQQAYWVKQCFHEYMRPPNKNNLDLLYEGLPTEGLYNCADENLILVRDKEQVLVPRLELLRKMRWTTLGYQYNWTTKEYDFDLDPALFPTDLSEFSRFTAEACGFGPSFRSEAGIVNFYGLGDTLTSHVDRSELTMGAPLISVSLGSACVFLVGGTDREDPVTPVILRSGDVSILSGPSRLFYHGVPRILPGTLPHHLAGIEAIRDARININIRQVT